MVDPKKLKAFMNAPIPMLAPPLPPELSAEEAEEIREALEDDMSEESQTARKLDCHVAYMELGESAGAFSCGTCKFSTPEGFCGHRDVRAYVSAESGCCNMFWPAEIQVVFPSESMPPKDMMSIPTVLR